MSRNRGNFWGSQDITEGLFRTMARYVILFMVYLRRILLCRNPEATAAFNQLKQKMVSTPVLTLPDYNKEFILESDASRTGLGVVLMQEGHPIACSSKGISTRDQALSTYKNELMTVVLAVLKWRCYLLGRHFIIRIDHQSLKYIPEQRVGTHFQQKWVTKLLGFDYAIVYKCGKDNQAADALSRREELHIPEDPRATIHALSCVSTSWLEKVKLSWEEDGDIQQLIRDLQQGQAHAWLCLGTRQSNIS